MVNGAQNQLNNSIIEKYCNNNNNDNCSEYGGLYQWDEAMQYMQQQGTRGICPPGWHIPTDQEWKVLEGATDSQYGIGDAEWDLSYHARGYDAGINLKSTYGWFEGENGADLFGFTGLPAGILYMGNFGDQPTRSYWWTSSVYSSLYAWARPLIYDYEEIWRYVYGNNFGFGMSVRCIKDE